MAQLLRKILLALGVGCALFGGAPAALGQAQVCENCTSVLDLSGEEWSCLLGRLDSFEKQQTALVFFTLTQNSCRTTTSTTQRGTGVRVPSAQQPSGARSASPPTVYRLTKEQVACIRERADNISAGAGRVHFSFAEKCALSAPVGASAKQND